MLSEKSVKNLRKVKQFILKEPRRFNMMAGVNSADTIGGQLEQPPCGTACCIAGASLLIEKRIKLSDQKCGLNFRVDEVIESGARFLGLGYDQKELLFYPWHWPEPYQQLYDRSTTAHERAAVGALMIEHFIATGGTE